MRHIEHELMATCHRWLVVGSVRRNRPTVNDLEVVCDPIIKPDAGKLFGDRSALMVRLDELEVDGRLRLIRGGERLRQYEIVKSALLKLEIHIPRPGSWGLIAALRTGPAAFSKRLVTSHSRGGYLLDRYFVAEGSVWDRPRDAMAEGGKPIYVPSMRKVVYADRLDLDEEMDFFALTTIGYVEPEDRSESAKISSGGA
jgi:hypothetical protein